MSNRKTEIAVGILYLMSTAAAISFFAAIGTATAPNEYLPKVAASQQIVPLGVLANIVNCCCVMGIAILLYPQLEKWSNRVAVTVLATRIIEVIVLLTGCLSVITLVELSGRSAPSGSNYLLGDLLLFWNDRSFDVAMIALSFGGFALAALLARYRLVPKWIALFGLIGYPIMLIKSSAGILQHPLPDWLFLPGAVFEFAFPVWLLLRGFKHDVEPINVSGV